MDERNDQQPWGRTYRIDLKRCVIEACGGKLTEVNYYERNNWVTVEYTCDTCGREFTVKIES